MIPYNDIIIIPYNDIIMVIHGDKPGHKHVVSFWWFKWDATMRKKKKWEIHGDFSSKDVGFEMFEPNINGNFRIQQMEVR